MGELDGLSVGCVAIRVRPGFLALAHGDPADEAFRRDEAFERGQPILVITGAIVGLTASGSGFDFVGKCRRR